jgi:hypothetical protein
VSAGRLPFVILTGITAVNGARLLSAIAPQSIVTKGAKVAAIAESIEISRRPKDAFSYATDFSDFPQRQRRVVPRPVLCQVTLDLHPGDTL